LPRADSVLLLVVAGAALILGNALEGFLDVLATSLPSDLATVWAVRW
jgi:hypothetical protein